MKHTPKQKATQQNNSAIKTKIACYFIENEDLQIIDSNKFDAVAIDETLEEIPNTIIILKRNIKLPLDKILSYFNETNASVLAIVPETKLNFTDKLKNELGYAFTQLTNDDIQAIAWVMKKEVYEAIKVSLPNTEKMLFDLTQLHISSKVYYIASKNTNSASSSLGWITKKIQHWIDFHFIKSFHLDQEKTFTQQSYWRFIYQFLIIGLFVLMPYLSQDFAISGDEYIHHRQAIYVDNYFKEGKTEALDQPKTLLHFYGQYFDYFALKLIQLTGTENIYETRHFLNALFGFFALFFTAATARLIGGYFMGSIAILLLALSPNFMGHSMNNPMDIPFAMAFIWAIFYLIKTVKIYPKFSIYNQIHITLALGLAIGMRVGGVLLIPYIVMVYGLLFLGKKPLQNIFNFSHWKANIQLPIAAAIISIVGFYLGLIYWPYGLQAPTENPFKALDAFTNISTGISQLFEGENLMSVDLPKHYLAKFIFITTPLVVLAGIPLAIFAMMKEFKAQKFIYFFIAFSTFFPLLYIAYKGSNVYGAWRHVLFIYPSLIVFIAIGWHYMIDKFSVANVKYLAAILFFIGIMLPLKFMVSAHPMWYVYFNETVGGLRGAYTRYESDYYSNAILPMSNWLKEQDFYKNRKDSLVIAANYGSSTEYYFRNEKGVKAFYTRYYNRSEQYWDYAIFYKGYIDNHQLTNGMWPPPGTIYTLVVDGAPMGAVVKRPSFDDYYGFQALKRGDVNGAIEYFSKYNSLVEKNDEVHAALANAYLMTNNFEPALEEAQKALAVYPDYVQAMDIKGRAQIYSGKYNEALATFGDVLKLKKNYEMAHYFIAYIYFIQQQYDTALSYINECLKINPNTVPAYQLGAACYSKKGDENMSRAYAEQAKRMGG
jgi:tetratricopeptide (TPR) repeat protein